MLDLRHLLHDMKLQRKIDDVAATTVNRTDMIMGLVWRCLEPLIAIATAPFPVLSLSLGLLLALKDGMLALHAYNQGDTDAALQHFVGYLSNSLGAVFTDLRPALKSIGPLVRPMRHHAPSRAARGHGADQTTAATDPRARRYAGRTIRRPAVMGAQAT